MSLSDEELAEIERVWAAATRGPWRAGTADKDSVFCADGASIGTERVLLRMNPHFPYQETAEAIAKAPEHVAALLAEVKRLRAGPANLVGLPRKTMTGMEFMKNAPRLSEETSQTILELLSESRGEHDD